MLLRQFELDTLSTRTKATWARALGPVILHQCTIDGVVSWLAKKQITGSEKNEQLQVYNLLYIVWKSYNLGFC